MLGGINTILFLSLLAVTKASNSATQLNYHDQEHWDGDCTVGKSQSPIDVPPPSSTVKIAASVPFLELKQNTFHDLINENNPNTAKYATSTIEGAAHVPWLDNREVQLLQLHLHWGKTAAHGSEHMIEGRAFAAEAHLVTSYTAADGTSKYTVFARVFKEGKPNPMLDQMIGGEKEDGTDRNIGKFDLSALYPADAAEWVTYQGGLTTPPCTEIVHWVIVKKPLTISRQQLKQLRKMHLGHGDMHNLNRNYRDIQDLNGRKSTRYVRSG